jgi:hypothetical protein
LAKKSPAGHSTLGCSWSSQYMRMIEWRHLPSASVIQICWIAPGPSISARVKVSPGSMKIDGLIFQPCPRPPALAYSAPVPSVAMPPLPLAPSKFSGLIERDFASDSRDSTPRLMPNPLNPAIALAPPFVPPILIVIPGLSREPMITAPAGKFWRRGDHGWPGQARP